MPLHWWHLWGVDPSNTLGAGIKVLLTSESSKILAVVEESFAMQIQEKVTALSNYQFTVLSFVKLRIFYFGEHYWKYFKIVMKKMIKWGVIFNCKR